MQAELIRGWSLVLIVLSVGADSAVIGADPSPTALARASQPLLALTTGKEATPAVQTARSAGNDVPVTD